MTALPDTFGNKVVQGLMAHPALGQSCEA